MRDTNRRFNPNSPPAEFGIKTPFDWFCLVLIAWFPYQHKVLDKFLDLYEDRRSVYFYIFVTL